MKISPPSFIYKYYNVSVLSLLNLKSQIFYFGSPKNFNDPYDCSLTPDFRELTDEQVEDIRNMYLAKPKITTVVREEFETCTTFKLKEAQERSVRKSIELERINQT